MRHLRVSLFLSCSALGLLLAGPLPAVRAQVRVSEEAVSIPTYVAGEAERSPMFFFGRTSQGAEGRIYPYAAHDTLTGQKVDQTYRMVYLENEYVKIGILPELGGRLFSGLDKTNNYDFVYRQHVIKPALIGLTGAWISGGIEWNVPHHHRATTFAPVQYRIEEHADGSKTVWVGELELRHRMRWAVGYTLRPGKSYVETALRIVNRTALPHSMLCFANIAVHVDDTYQVIFPPSTQWVTGHHKRAFTPWPIASGNPNIPDGTDVSWCKNHLHYASMFAWNYVDDFMAGYNHGKEAGLMGVANHHIVPGKKLWTWGNDDHARMWEKILTDDDGPYIELMMGGYSDNQPDYSWMAPYETRDFSMYWYPFRGIGGVKNANVDAGVNLEIKGSQATVGFCTTSAHPQAVARLKAKDQVLLEETMAIGPDRPFLTQVALPAGTDEHDVRASLWIGEREVVGYTPVRLSPEPMPAPVKAPDKPDTIKTNDELYLDGLWIRQFHNASREPDPYWEEALRRDPGDVQVNTAMGILYLDRYRFAQAERYLRKALERLMVRHAMPENGDPYYYLGMALKAQGKTGEAYDAFYRATWSAEWRTAGYYALAQIDAARDDLATALTNVERSLQFNALNLRALNLKAALLRHSGRLQEAGEVLAFAASRVDPLDVQIAMERMFLQEDQKPSEELLATLRNHPAVAMETIAEYLSAGLWQDAERASSLVLSAQGPEKVSPLVYYCLGYICHQTGRPEEERRQDELAMRQSPDYVFPFQAEMIAVLRRAMEVNPQDARAPYYLGNLLFDGWHEEAVALWETSASLDPSFSIVQRNLALAYADLAEQGALEKAIACLEKAVSAPRKYPLHFFELDQLYEAAGTSPQKRLSMLEENHDVVARRDDALSREISLKVFAGKYDEAIELMKSRQFHIWEGGARFNVHGCWSDAHLLRGQRHLAAGQFQEALADFGNAIVYPLNLQAEREVSDDRNAEVHYWQGMAWEALSETEKARQAWQEAAESGDGKGGRGSERYYQALALQKLGETDQARTIFQELVTSGEKAGQKSTSGSDFFSSFGDRQSQRAKIATAHYLAGLGHLGLGEVEQARGEFQQALQAGPDHADAQHALQQLEATGQRRP